MNARTSSLRDFVQSPTRFLFFTCKGGVGKTSLACATAIALADAGRRVLLASTDPASNLDEVLGVKLGAEPRAVPSVPRLHALYTYGPYVFVGLSAIFTATLAPRIHRALTGMRGRMLGRRRARRVRLMALASALVLFWAVGTAVGATILALARSGPTSPSEPLAGSHVDAFVLAHMAPPLGLYVARAP